MELCQAKNVFQIMGGVQLVELVGIDDYPLDGGAINNV